MCEMPRKRTLYVPSDDTTILASHPSEQGDQIQKETSVMEFGQGIRQRSHAPTDHGEVLQMNSFGRKALAAAPKRAPLQPRLRSLRAHGYSMDVFETEPRKENIRPFTYLDISQNYKSKPFRARRASISAPAFILLGCPQGSQRSVEPQSSEDLGSSRRALFELEAGDRLPKDIGIRKPQHSMLRQRNPHCYCRLPKSPIPAPEPEPFKVRSKLANAVLPTIDTARKQTVPLQRENTDHPEVVEDASIGHYDAAIQQLINRLFDAETSGELARPIGHDDRRRALLGLYQKVECWRIHKRLQASLSCGILKPTGRASLEHKTLNCDVGFRRKFTALWSETYELSILSAAIEVIIGESPALAAQDTDSIHSIPTADIRHDTFKLTLVSKERQVLKAFLETCLKNEHASEANESSPGGWSWRRTTLRCLMLILLLDRARETGLVSGNLFRTRSEYKSSRQVLIAVYHLLCPSIGDVSRLLSRLDYKVQHVQTPLSEYRYRITNLAIDLRDGVRLARLVDILFYHSQARDRVQQITHSAMPTRERSGVLVEDRHLSILSQYMRVPCLSRTQRICNVQITLDALRGVGGMGIDIARITAENIADGHREETMNLLWNLVRKRNLDTLVDVADTGSKIQRVGELHPACKCDRYESADDNEYTLDRLAK